MQLTIFNGSPRGRRSNTRLLLEQIQAGFEETPGNHCQIFDLVRLHDLPSHTQAFEQAGFVLLGFPLYTDGMPAIVKAFIESLEPCLGSENNPRLAFLVQSGFPEADQSRRVERYLVKLARRLGSPYAGTLVKGNIEGLRLNSAEQNAALFAGFRQCGRDLALHGEYDPALLLKLAQPERFPASVMAVIRFINWTRLVNFQGYWDTQLKANGAYDQRNATPYL